MYLRSLGWRRVHAPREGTAVLAGTAAEPREVASIGPGVRKQGPAGRSSRPDASPLAAHPRGKRRKDMLPWGHAGTLARWWRPQCLKTLQEPRGWSGRGHTPDPGKERSPPLEHRKLDEGT